MKRSVLVQMLANLASKSKFEVTPSNVGTLAREINTLFTETAEFINELEGAESAETLEKEREKGEGNGDNREALDSILE